MRTKKLFAFTVVKLMSGLFIYFLFQGCCPCYNSSIVKPKSGLRLNNADLGNRQTNSVTESMALVETIPARETIVYPAALTSNHDYITPNENFFFISGESKEIISPSSTVAEADPMAYGLEKKSEDRDYISAKKFKTAMSIKGKQCPFRSITSHIIAGPNISFKSSKEGDDVYGNSGHKHEPGIGFQVGMGSAFGFTEKFSVNTALLVKQNNASEKITYAYTDPGSPGGGGSGGETKDKYSYTYISAPVVASYKVGKQTEVFAGPEINYLLKASVKREGGTGGDDKENITENSVKLGVGVQAGFKYKIPSGNGDSPFGIQLLYEHRLSRLNKKDPDGNSTYDVPAWNMKGFQLGVTCSICELKKGKK